MGDEQELVGRMYRRHGSFIHRQCLRMLQDDEAARDATHDAFEKLIGAPTIVRNPAAALAWILRVARNRCLNHLRDSKRTLSDRVTRPSKVAVLQRDLSDRELVDRLLSRCDERTRRVAVGVLIEGQKHAELAMVIGVSRRTIGRTLDRFLDAAREFLRVNRDWTRR